MGVKFGHDSDNNNNWQNNLGKNFQNFYKYFSQSLNNFFFRKEFPKNLFLKYPKLKKLFFNFGKFLQNGRHLEPLDEIWPELT